MVRGLLFFSKLADLLGQLQGMALQSARSNHAGKRQQPEGEVALPNAYHAYRGDDAARNRWSHVLHRTTK
jgi:hypothetical protein